MKLQQQVRGEDTVLTLSGMATAGDAADALAAALAAAESGRSGSVVCDVQGVQHLDSTALGVLVGAMRRLHAAGRDISLVNPGRRIVLLLELTSLSSLFPTHATVADALASQHHRAGRGDSAVADRNRHDI